MAFYHIEMNNREITEYLRENGIHPGAYVTPVDLIFTIGRLDDVCEASIQIEQNLNALTTRVNELETLMARMRDAHNALAEIVRQRLAPHTRRPT